MVTAKFGCSMLVTEDGGSWKQEKVRFHAAYGPGNEQWSQATPSGTIEMTITNPTALSQFKPNKHYKVTFEEIE